MENETLDSGRGSDALGSGSGVVRWCILIFFSQYRDADSNYEGAESKSHKINFNFMYLSVAIASCTIQMVS